ncbi:MAG TPA: ABC transporter ATP-binding protein [Candidatus Limivivens intestinipullorum]|uniref:ABC transporter ATP-binding protein n=1 Tax=Candidatus Limivivens intestinipullorum TaxID=2840858 RepID=A0A9D1JKM8_9FIRM|nr:ABC transporter ATP-binding protein [Candidatus Limivivens intestinipullorum]
MKNKASGRQNVLFRIIKTLFEFYPVLMPVVLICIVFNAIISSIPSVFMQNIISIVEESWQAGDWVSASGRIVPLVGLLILFYVLSLAASIVYNQMMAFITQGSLKKFREKMFNGMESLPIRYFDTHSHGDIMSYYTNDIDTLRQMISQSLPQLTISIVTVLTVLFVMLYYSVWMTLVVVLGVAVMIWVTRVVGGNSAKYFVRQQIAIGKTEGFVEEMMNGQKVVKVFCHEEEAKADFDKVNDALFEDAKNANKYANMLMPILGNIGNILYSVVAMVGGILLLTNAPNLSISGLGLGISIVVPFLNMTKQFSGNVSQVSNQVNSVVMGLAGAQRIFSLIDEEPEPDEGYVTLVNAKEVNGKIVESQERTGMWAWKHPHSADGTVTYTKLEGDVRMFDVDFGYTDQKIVLHNITLYAEPGQKVAFVGATGAGKTTITNLINRFYDIADGKIRYDGININKIKKADLRASLGMILQDTNLFTGTVMDNIRYGKLDATDEECIAAAKLAGADDFITRLPQGYDTQLSGNGSNLSQGQRQLLSIARAAVADPPVMIMDEATSSIDTRTEAIVQKGMDALMKGRTVFVIAHRLSTVRNSDVIMVLDHGRIIERGTHDKLIEEKGTYYQLYTGAFELE